MYSANYPFGNPAPPFNNASPQQQPGMQPGQQMMYNQQQQFPGMAPQGGFPQGGNPQMMQGTHPGMMQNQGMPNMGPNGQMAGFQQQFPGAPYGQQVLSSSVGQQNFTPNNYMMGGGGMQGFPMNQAGMPPQQQQQMMQRMQQQQQQQQMNPGMAQASTPQRPPSSAQGTPNPQMPQQHGQFSTPQPPSQGQTPASHQQQPMGQSTPQTPTFAQNQAGNAGPAQSGIPPMSPGAISRERERFALLLDINHELLYESIQIQTTQQELKKENAAEGNQGEKKNTQEESAWNQDYLQCMKRLQANLTYMAAVADRKPEVKVPPCPAFLSPPQLNLSLRLRANPIGMEGNEAQFDPLADREHRDMSIKELYQRLQEVFPGIDPKKEPTYRQAPAGAQRPGNPGMNQTSPTSQQAPQMPNMNAPQPGQAGSFS